MKLSFDLIDFINQESPKESRRVMYLAILVGLTSTLLIALVNSAASKVSKSSSVTTEFFLYLFLLLSFLTLLRKLTSESVNTSQTLIHKFKMRLMRDVFLSNLVKVDGIGRVNILQALGRDAQTVSQSIPGVISACQALATLIFLSFYMASISLIAFAIISISSILILYFSTRFVVSADDSMREAWQKEASIHEIFSDFLNGFKEIKMNSLRARDISKNMVDASRSATKMKADALISVSNFFNYLQVLLYVVVGIIIFIVPIFSSEFSSSVVPATTATIFLVGSLAGVITSIPSLSMANASARSLLNLERELEGLEGENLASKQEQKFSDFNTLELKELCYSYSSIGNTPSFSVGPINLTFEAGKVYFIRGGNGSGKTTIMRLLLGLYPPSSGEILLDNVKVLQPTSNFYRDLFSVVFSDFHLFQNLYGINKYSEESLERWKLLLQMESKIKIEDGVFSSINLSTGQKKRVALLVALMEERPIMVLDEWAADQDPEFRGIFYNEIIPIFKIMGKTVIAITHDDAYFDRADFLITIKDGAIYHSEQQI